MSGKSFYRNSLFMSIVVFISRIFGFLRDVILANFFGTSLLGDSFFLAFRIPNTFRRLLGEGAFNSAFIPVYSGYISGDARRKEGWFLGNLFIRFSFVLVLISLLGTIFSEEIVSLFTLLSHQNGSFSETTSNLLKITFWYLTLVGLGAFFMGIQQANDSFAKPAAGQIVYNISFILFLVLLFKVDDPQKQVYIAATGVILAGLLQTGYQIFQAVKLKRPFILNLSRENEKLKKLLKIITPAIFGQAIVEINLIADSIFALFLSGGVISAMYYANRITQLPLGIFAVSISIVSLTLFSKRINSKKSIEKELKRSVNSLVTIIMPLTSFLIGGGIYVIKVLFMRGEFTAESAQLTNMLLIYYSVGLIVFSFIKLFSQIFYSHRNMVFPVIFTSVAMVINVELNAILVFPMGAGGLALASTISAGVNLLLLFLYTYRRYSIKPPIKLFFKIIPVSIVMSLVLLYLQPLAEKLVDIKWEFLKNILLATGFFIINIIPYLLIFGTKNIIKAVKNRGTHL